MEKSAILSVLAEEVEKGRLIFPTSVNAALKTKQKLEDLDCNLDTVIRIIQAEPLLSTKVVAIANSTVFNRSGKKLPMFVRLLRWLVFERFAIWRLSSLFSS